MSIVNDVSYVGTSLIGSTHAFDDAEITYRHPDCSECNLRTLDSEPNSLYVGFTSETPLLLKNAPKLLEDGRIETNIVEDDTFTDDSGAISKYFFRLELDQRPETGEWEIQLINKTEEDDKDHVYILRKS